MFTEYQLTYILQTHNSTISVRLSSVCLSVCRWCLSTNISLYFQNSTRYDHSNNGRRIETRVRSIEWCHFHRPQPIFQCHDIIQSQVTRKWYKIQLYLQWQTNRVVHDLSLSITLNDLEQNSP